MITIPSGTVLFLAATSLVVLMICQWFISGAWLHDRRKHTAQLGPANSARTEFHQAA